MLYLMVDIFIKFLYNIIELNKGGKKYEKS